MVARSAAMRGRQMRMRTGTLPSNPRRGSLTVGRRRMEICYSKAATWLFACQCCPLIKLLVAFAAAHKQESLDCCSRI